MWDTSFRVNTARMIIVSVECHLFSMVSSISITSPLLSKEVSKVASFKISHGEIVEVSL